MAKKEQPKVGVVDRVLYQDLDAPAKPKVGSSINERLRGVQSIKSVDAGLSAPSGSSLPIGGVPRGTSVPDAVSLGVDHRKLPQSSLVSTPNISRGAGTTTTRGHSTSAAMLSEVATHHYLFGKVQNPAPATVQLRSKKAGSVIRRDIGLGDEVPRGANRGPYVAAKQQVGHIRTPKDAENYSEGHMAGLDETLISLHGLGVKRQEELSGMMVGSETRPSEAPRAGRWKIGEETPTPTRAITPKTRRANDPGGWTRKDISADKARMEKLKQIKITSPANPEGVIVTEKQHAADAALAATEKKKSVMSRIVDRHESMQRIESGTYAPKYDAGLSAETVGDIYPVDRREARRQYAQITAIKNLPKYDAGLSAKPKGRTYPVDKSERKSK